MAFSLYHLLHETALRWPARPALRFGGQDLSYEDFVERVGKIAHRLIEQGVTRGDRVALYMHRSFDSMAAIFGILQAGAAYVPLDSAAPVAPLASVLDDCEIRHLVTEESHFPRVSQIVEEYRGLRSVIGLEPRAEFPVDECLSWEQLRQSGTGPVPGLGVIEEDLSVIFYTSGSTGKPKGVAHSHRSMLSNVEWALSKFGLTPEDRLSAVTSHHFDLSWFELFAGFGAGSALVLIPEQTVKFPIHLGEVMEQERLSVWCSVPSVLMQLTQRGELRSRDLGPLRWVLFAGERFPTKHLRDLMTCVPHPRFCNMYGTTETHIAAFYDVQPIPEGSDDPLPIGRACAHVNLMAVDPQGRQVEPGATGELVVRGPSVMEGYWRQPERTSTVLVKYRFGEQLEGLCYRTGDLVQLRPDGNYYIIGRGDRRVKVRGNLVDLDEVEKALLADERVQESAVYLITEEDEALSRLGAAVVLKPGASAQSIELRHGLSLQLPAYALPNHIAILPDLPRTGSGKISRRALQAMEAEQPAAAADGGKAGAAEPAGVQEGVRHFILTELLSSGDGADLDDETDLFMTGLIDSLSVVRLLTFMEEKYSISVPSEHFVEENFNTLASIRRLVERLQGEGARTAAEG